MQKKEKLIKPKVRQSGPSKNALKRDSSGKKDMLSCCKRFMDRLELI